MEEPIYFYDQKLPNFEFSNFYPASIIIDGVTYPTSEHYYQSEKFIRNPQTRQMIIDAKLPGEAFKLARIHQDEVIPEWHCLLPKKSQKGVMKHYKDKIMMKALKAKFTQHPDLRKILLKTGSRPLVEHTYRDNYWADGGDGSGNNVLGQLLMQLRDNLKKK
jgi:ribA/ribD-fused uncharacterized protein